jgi:hypothetical protein
MRWGMVIGNWIMEDGEIGNRYSLFGNRGMGDGAERFVAAVNRFAVVIQLQLKWQALC